MVGSFATLRAGCLWWWWFHNKQHSKFGTLPPDIRTHILTQNIDLCRVAPYRTLLGMDDRVLEQEQAEKFIRVR